MYPRPVTSEECLHNVLLVLEALRALDFEYDIQVSSVDQMDPAMIDCQLVAGFYIRLMIFVCQIPS